MLNFICENAEQVHKVHSVCADAISQAFSGLKILDAQTGNKELRTFALAELAGFVHAKPKTLNPQP